MLTLALRGEALARRIRVKWSINKAQGITRGNLDQKTEPVGKPGSKAPLGLFTELKIGATNA